MECPPLPETQLNTPPPAPAAGPHPQVGYLPGLALQGGTPAYLPPLLTFNHLLEVGA